MPDLQETIPTAKNVRFLAVKNTENIKGVLRINSSDISKKKESGRTVDCFKFYFVTFMISAFFFLVLDLNFRSGAVGKQLTFWTFIKNLVFMTSFLGLSGMIVSGLFTAGFAAINRLCKTKDSFADKKTNSAHECPGLQGGKARKIYIFVSTFILFMLLIYINLLYFKFFLMSLTYMNVTMIHKGMKFPLILAVLAAVAIFVVYREKIIGKFWNISTKAYRVFVSIILFCIVTSLVLYIASSSIILEKNSEAAQKSLKEKQKKPNIIFLTFDSLNAPHMTTYGYYRNTCPNINEFANKSTVFEQMRSNTNSTGEALDSFLGTYPRPPGRGSEHSFLEVLKKYYPTRKFISVTYFSKKVYRDMTDFTTIRRFEKTRIAKILFTGKNRENFWWLSQVLSEPVRFYNLFYLIDPRSMDVKTGDPYPLPLYFDEVIDTLKSSPKPVFVWAHMFEPHFPYLVPSDFKDYFGKLEGTYELTLLIGITNRELLTDRYDTCIRYLDKEFGIFIEKLKKLGFYDNSIIIISSDHGESFGDPIDGLPGYGLFGHGGIALNDEVTHIPLIIHTPGQVDGNRVETFAEQVDIAPTILDYLDIKKPGWMEGESLVRYVKQSELKSKKMKITIPGSHFYRRHWDYRRRPRVDFDIFHIYWNRYKIGFRQEYKKEQKPGSKNEPTGFKFIFVYDVFADPQQKNNLIGEDFVAPILDRIYNSPLLKYYREN